MDKLKNKYKISTLIVSLIIGVMVLYLNFVSHDKTQEIYLAQTKSIVIDLKKDFLKDTIENVILEIDTLRKTKYENYQKNADSRLRRFEEELDLSDEEFIELFISRFENDPNPIMWTALLWNEEIGEIIYATPDLKAHNLESGIKEVDIILSSHAKLERGNIKAIFGTSKAYIDGLVKSEIEVFIKNRKFSNNSYIWVNEILDYNGGQAYAIRRIHPNLVDTEGLYLSTDMEDINGNLPYLEELEGINKYGELFFTYYFKNLNSSEIIEKLTYAKHYPDYNWVIAMGVNLDDIALYTEKTNEEIYSLTTMTIIRLLRYILITLLLGFLILYIINRKRISSSTRSFEQVINNDSLTNSNSRTYGEKTLEGYFKTHKETGEKVAVMMFDIDDFKQINDTYGHKAGDTALVEVVNAINNIIRSSDKLIRWGGDEFVGIFPGLHESNALEFGEKFLSKLSSIDIQIGEKTINLTISIGFSYFKTTDSSYSEVLKRADEAMYISKNQGKNRVNLIL